MPPVNILFTLPNLSPTSSKLPRVLAICKALDRERFQPLVSVDHAGRLHADGLRLLKEADVPVHLIRMSPHKRTVTRSLFEMAETPRALRRAQVVIQHSSDYSKGWTEPLLARVGGVKHWINTKTNADCLGWHWQLRLRLAERVIIQTPQIATLLAGAVPGIESRLILIPNGVDTNVFRLKPRDENLVRDLSLDHGDLILGCVAHLVHVKDHPSLLRAIKSLQRTDIILLLIGSEVDPRYAKEVRRLVDELGLNQQVRFLGRRSDVDKLHSVMDGLVLTSENESSSNAVLEGMASGLPIIASEVGGMRDAVQPGINGWLVPRGEGFVERLAATIEEWAADPQRRQAYGTASRRIVEERFSLNQMVQGHIQLYESLLEQHV